jgi:hypothetical protein
MKHLLIDITFKLTIWHILLLVHTFEMGFEIIRTRPNFKLAFTGADRTKVTITKCLAIRVHTPLVPIKVIRCTKALFSTSAVLNIAFEWFRVALVVLPMMT